MSTRETVTMPARDFDDLLEYSCSVPSQTTIGKRWKRREGKGWLLGEYVEHSDPKLTGIRWSKLIRAAVPTGQGETGE